MLIFDSFPSERQLEHFQARVRREHPELEQHVHADITEAMTCDPIPAELHPPIVHVERPYSGHDSDIERAREGGFADGTPTGAELEELIERLAPLYGGRFVGT